MSPIFCWMKKKTRRPWTMLCPVLMSWSPLRKPGPTARQNQSEARNSLPIMRSTSRKRVPALPLKLPAKMLRRGKVIGKAHEGGKAVAAEEEGATASPIEKAHGKVIADLIVLMTKPESNTIGKSQPVQNMLLPNTTALNMTAHSTNPKPLRQLMNPGRLKHSVNRVHIHPRRNSPFFCRESPSPNTSLTRRSSIQLLLR